jgi:preprotein translocase subunit SecG
VLASALVFVSAIGVAIAILLQQGMDDMDGMASSAAASLLERARTPKAQPARSAYWIVFFMFG